MKRILALIAAFLLLAATLCSCDSIKNAVRDYVEDDISDALSGQSPESAAGDYLDDELSGIPSGDIESILEDYLKEELSTGSAVTETTDPIIETTDPIIETTDPATEAPTEDVPQTKDIDYFGSYTTKEDVALYIKTYGTLPSNFITKKEAEALGWSGGSLEPYAPGKSIGGDYFGNYEGLLPTKRGRTYTECDIDTLGAKSRGAKRIVFSNDGLIYYTGDHYESFTLLYGGD